MLKASLNKNETGIPLGSREKMKEANKEVRCEIKEGQINS